MVEVGSYPGAQHGGARAPAVDVTDANGQQSVEIIVSATTPDSSGNL